MANVVILPRGRESVTAVPKLKGEIPLGPVGQMMDLKIVCCRLWRGFHEGTMCSIEFILRISTINHTVRVWTYLMNE